ncbi:MAG: DUF1707 domain-containing protein [Actinobacteria bacterium]|nr:DUF1707 domain-containing protein [Actinomycetota bacterium]
MRASDADRDGVLAELSEHFQAGRLTMEEFDERSSMALRARTFGELADLTKDLPTVPHLSAVPAKRSKSSGPRLPVAAVAAALALVALVLTALTVGGASLGDRHVWWIVLAVPLVAWRVSRSRR